MLSPDERAQPADMLWPDNYKATDNVKFGTPTDGADDIGGAGLQFDGSAGFTGQIATWPMRIPPLGWIKCDGSLKTVEEFPNLFSVLVPNLGDVTFSPASGGDNNVALTGAINILEVGDKVIFTSGGTLPDFEDSQGNPLTQTVFYVWDFDDDDHFRLATQMEAIPIFGNIVAIQDAGSGVHSVRYAPYATTSDDGLTQFTLPDAQNRFLLGQEPTQNALGQTGGESEHQLTAAEMPIHTHAFQTRYGGNANTIGPRISQVQASGSGATTSSKTKDTTWIDNEGGDEAHNNMPPYLVINHIIKT